jgi:hypothetical protein
VTLSPQERRNLLLSTYFGDSLATRLFKVEWKNLRLKVMHKEVAASQIMYALNGTIVGLCYDPVEYEYPDAQEVFYRLFDLFLTFYSENWWKSSASQRFCKQHPYVIVWVLVW